MYKCQLCGYQSGPYETQFTIITKKRKLQKGWEIAELKKGCYKCAIKLTKE